MARGAAAFAKYHRYARTCSRMMMMMMMMMMMSLEIPHCVMCVIASCKLCGDCLIKNDARILDEDFLWHFLIRCRNDVEKTKIQLNLYYIAKYKMPDIFTNRDPSSAYFKKCTDLGYVKLGSYISTSIL